MVGLVSRPIKPESRPLGPILGWEGSIPSGLYLCNRKWPLTWLNAEGGGETDGRELVH